MNESHTYECKDNIFTTFAYILKLTQPIIFMPFVPFALHQYLLIFSEDLNLIEGIK